MKKASIIISFVLSLMAFGCSLSSSPGDVAKEFYTLLGEGKVNDAFELLSTDTQVFLKKMGGVAILSDKTKSISGKGGVKSIEVKSEEVMGDTAEVSTEVTYGNGATDTHKDNLVKEDGKWRLTFSK